MSIRPITATRLKTFLLLGHSNANGFANYANMTTYEPALNAKCGSISAESFALSPDLWERAYWDNVFVATSAQPFPGVDNTPVEATPGDVRWLEMTIANPWDPSVPHPHPSPWNYPNTMGSCWPRWYYCAWPEYAPGWQSGATSYLLSGSTAWPSPADSPSGVIFSGAAPPSDPLSPNWDDLNYFRSTMVGMEVPFSFLWRGYWQEQIGIVKVAFPSSRLMPFETASSTGEWVDTFTSGYLWTPSNLGYIRSASNGVDYNFYAYWTPEDSFDWAPATDRLYKMWYDKMVGAAADLATQSDAQPKMDVQCVILMMGDNDSANISQDLLQANFQQTYRALIKRIRYDLKRNDWTSLRETEIPIICVSVFHTYTGPNDSPGFSSVDFCNEQIQAIAADDPFVKWVDSSEWNTMDDDGDVFLNNIIPTNGPGHYGSRGYIQGSQDVFDAWLETQVTPYDALDKDTLVTVSEVKRRVRSYYSRARSTTDIDDTTLLDHINAALYHTINFFGDNVWWLRHRETMELNIGPNVATTMPRYVNRVLKIENPLDLRKPVLFEMIGHGSGGKVQINVIERVTGSYVVHYMTGVRRLNGDDELVPVPDNLIEFLVLEVCARLARANANQQLETSYQVQAANLGRDLIRNMSQVQRARQDRFKTQRRMVRLGYSRTGFGPWGINSSV